MAERARVNGVDASAAPEKVEKLTFFYLDKRVRGEQVRLALVVAGIPFEDVRTSYEDVHELRTAGHLPFSQVPALQIGEGGPLRGQSNALLRWAGRRGGLYPDEYQLQIDAVLDVVAELYTEMIKAGYGAVMGRHPETGRPMVPLTPQQREAVRRCCGEVLFPARLRQLERIFDEAGGPYFCGAALTIADLSFYVLFSAVLAGAWAGNGVGPEVVPPKLAGLVRRVGEHPRIAAWNAAHPADWFG